MNCKPGDLAVMVISTFLGGSLCNVLRPTQIGDRDSLGCVDLGLDGPGWHVELLAPRWFGGQFYCKFMFYDRYLRPIRDQDGDDETLTWAGKPEKVGA